MRGTFLLAISALVAAPSAAKAQNFVSGDVQLLQHAAAANTQGPTVITGEFAWAKGTCGGFGFLDVFPSGGPLKYVGTTNVDCTVKGPVYVSIEGGASNFGVSGRVGFGLHLKVPGMKFVDVTLYPLSHSTEGDKRQVKVVWMSKDVSIDKRTSVYFAGFARIRDGAPVIIQPQVWVKRTGLPVEFGAEVGVYGRQAGLYAAAKVSF